MKAQVVGLLLVIVVPLGCTTPTIGLESIDSHDPIVMVEKGIAQLNANIEQLSKRVAKLKDTPGSADPAIRKLRALDLSGWELHQRQWLLQRNRLEFARTQLARAKEHPHERSRLAEEWTALQQQYETSFDDARQQRHILEQERLEAEGRFIGESILGR